MNPNEWKARMEKYEQELLQMRKTSRFSAENKQEMAPREVEMPVSPVAAVPTPEREHFQGNISQEEGSGAYARRPIMPRTASLRVRATATDNNAPVSGALVSVDKRTRRGREPLYVRLTDAEGYTEALLLPVGEPDTVFDVSASAAGFYHDGHTGLVPRGEPLEITLRLAPVPEL